MNSPMTVSLVGRTTTGSSSSLPPATVTTASSGLKPSTCSASRCEVRLGDEQREVGVLGAAGLDAGVDLGLHPLPERVAVGADDHGAADRAVLGQLAPCCRTSWYQRGKSSARGVSTGRFRHAAQGSDRAPRGLDIGRNPTELIENISDLVAGISDGKPGRLRHLWRSTCKSSAPSPSIPRSRPSWTRFEDGVRRYLAGEIDDDAFRVFRLNQGIYGQRQGGHNQMLRVKIPYGKVEPDQLEMLGLHRRDLLARLGSPHHPPERAVPLRAARADTPEALRLLASVGLTSREACGDTVRNVAGLPPRRRVPLRGARHQPVGRGHQGRSSCATRSRSACRGSSRSTSRAAPPTAARRCSTTSAWSR